MQLKNRIEHILLEHEVDLYDYSDTVITEAGANINRVLEHLNSDNTCSMTAYRSNYSHKQNELRNKKLANDIRNLGYSYIRIIGSYIEKGNTELTEENSFLIIDKDLTEEGQNKFFNNMLKLCELYDQDSVLISLPNNKNILPASYNKNGNIEYGPFKSLNIDKMNEFFTKIHGHKYFFENIAESIGIKPDSYSHANAYYGTHHKLK